MLHFYTHLKRQFSGGIEMGCWNGLSWCVKLMINPFYATVSFYTPWKHQKIRGFLMFSGGIYRKGAVAWNGLSS